MLKKYIFYLLLLILICWRNEVPAQERNNLSVQLGFLQVKEEFNQGLVFNGPQLGINYEHYWKVSECQLLYAPELSVGVPFSKGMTAICLNITPIDVSFFKHIYRTKTQSVRLGLNVTANYKYQEYPDLQNAHLFWFGEIGLSPCIKYEYRWQKSMLKLSLTNSLLGFTSHTQTNDPYFYSFKFSDFIVRPHQNMKFGSFNRYNHTAFHLEFSPDKKLNHLFRSGINFENDGLNGDSNMLLRQIPDNSLDFILGLPTIHEQGKVFKYNDGDPHILSAILQSQTGKSVREWARDVLFMKLEMQNYDWIMYKDGITMGAFGMLATPREMAKIGQLVLNKGQWNGNKVVSNQWIREITSTKVSAPKVDYYNKSFGYYWWIDESRGVVFMNGQGGQYVFVKPDKNLLVVITAEPNTQGKHQFSVHTAFEIFDKIDRITRTDK